MKPPAFRYQLLFVGVNAVPGGPPLHAAARDAEAMSARFRGWGYDHRGRHALLLDQEATTERVTDEIRSARAAAALDLLLIYWAGHLDVSGRTLVLATEDAAADGSAPGIGLDVLIQAVGMATGVPHRVLILDACHGEAAHAPLAALGRPAGDDECIAVFAGGAGDAMSREDLRRGYFTGALLEQLPRDTRGLPPNIDLLQALRMGAEHLTGRRRELPYVAVGGGETELRLPAARGRTSLPESRARAGRPATRLIAAHTA